MDSWWFWIEWTGIACALYVLVDSFAAWNRRRRRERRQQHRPLFDPPLSHCHVLDDAGGARIIPLEARRASAR